MLPHPAAYKTENGETLVPLEDSRQVFQMSSRPQLSIHKSGLVQLSGEGIRSGVDPTGNPKGAAIRSLPLDTPISTGPTCSAEVWGVSKGYKKVDPSKKGLVVYEEKDFVRKPSDARHNAFTFNIWVTKIPDKATPNHFFDESGAEFATFRFEFYAGNILTMRLFRLAVPNLAIGIIPVTEHTDWADEEPYGFYLSSPMGRAGTDTKGLYSLHVFSPFLDFGGFLKNNKPPSLDFLASK